MATEGRDMKQEHFPAPALSSERPWGLPPSLANTVQRYYHYQVAVETGTYQGASTRILRELVGSVYTIESNLTLYENARQNLAHDPNIHVLFGSSPAVLPSVLNSLDSCALFWLDAHWFPEVPDVAESQCPLLDELFILAQWPFISDSCVLIDDARMFSTPLEKCYQASDWPTLREVITAARFTPSTVTAIIDDVIVVGPSTLTVALNNYAARPGPQVLYGSDQDA
jgi:hypothetical protein